MRKLFCCFFLLIFAGCSSKSSPPATSTATPTSTAVVVGPGKVQLNWVASTGNPQGYLVEQSIGGGTFSQISSVTANTVTITGLTLGQTYYFRVRAYNQSGNSAYTANATATP